jgi:hypothetical protein
METNFPNAKELEQQFKENQGIDARWLMRV